MKQRKQKGGKAPPPTGFGSSWWEEVKNENFMKALLLSVNNICFSRPVKISRVRLHLTVIIIRSPDPKKLWVRLELVGLKEKDTENLSFFCFL